MKKFRQKFFESFQSDRRKKNKSIAKYFLGRLQKNMFFSKNVSKSAFRFPEEYSNLFEPFFFAGKLMPKEWSKRFLYHDQKHFSFHQNSHCDTYPSDIHTSLILLGYCIKPTKVNLYLQRGFFVFMAPAKKHERLKLET